MLFKRTDHLKNNLFTFANKKSINKIRHWLGVETRLTTRDDQWVVAASFGRTQRQSSEVENIQGVGIE